jgi:hypothetical protein
VATPLVNNGPVTVLPEVGEIVALDDVQERLSLLAQSGSEIERQDCLNANEPNRARVGLAWRPISGADGGGPGDAGGLAVGDR